MTEVVESSGRESTAKCEWVVMRGRIGTPLEFVAVVPTEPLARDIARDEAGSDGGCHVFRRWVSYHIDLVEVPGKMGAE